MASSALMSFMDGFSGYNQVKITPKDMTKTTFTTEWGIYFYIVMPVGLKNAGASYQRMAITLLHDIMHNEVCGHNGESPPSFCNGLRTIYIASFRGRNFWSYYQSMSLEFSYGFGKVLGTQNNPTLGLASSHCVLCLNPIKGIFNIVSILIHTLAYI